MTNAAIRAATEQFCARIPEQLAAFETLLLRILASRGEDREAIERARFEAHRMAGTAGSFGFGQLGALYARIDTHLKALPADKPEDAAHTETQLRELLPRLLEEGRNATADKVEWSGLEAALSAHQKSARADAEEIRAGKPGFSEERILIADDDASIRALVRRILLDNGTGEVLLAASGSEALHLAALHKPSLIVSDWNMSPVSGIELLQTIREARADIAPDTPIVFLTRENQSSELRTAVHLGVDHFVLKPFAADGLIRAVRSVLERRRAAEPPPVRPQDLVEI